MKYLMIEEMEEKLDFRKVFTVEETNNLSKAFLWEQKNQGSRTIAKVVVAKVVEGDEKAH